MICVDLFVSQRAARGFGIIAVSICGVLPQAVASPHVYAINGATSQSKILKVPRTFSGERVIDSIPQLGIILTENPIANLRGTEDLGEVKTIRLNPDLRNKSLTPRFSKKLWGLRSLKAEEAWGISTGKGILIAVSDTGIDSRHPDLKDRMWNNPGETGVDSVGNNKASNGIDDDSNGYVDDVFGWDFVKNKNSGNDHHYHGTHVSGTIAARIGEAGGVAPDATLMDVSFLDSNGSGLDLMAAKTIVYAADQGAKILNCSWGSPEVSPLVVRAIEYARTKGMLIVAAAGNDGKNTDRNPNYPSSIDSDNIIAVAAIDDHGHMPQWSNWGAKTVDIGAPGENIYSLEPSVHGKAKYQYLDGTSMASPHAAGVAALIWSAHPEFSWVEVKDLMLSTAAPTPSMKGSTVSGGILDAAHAVRR